MRGDAEGSSSPCQPVSRRTFGQAAALTVAGGLFLPSLVSAANEQVAGPAAAQDEVEAKLRSVIAQWGDRLSEAQRQRIRRILQYHVRMLQAVRAFPVQNGDSPASVLKLVGSRTAAKGDHAEPRRGRNSHGE